MRWNFNLVLILLLIAGCGVKSPPSAPKGTAIPSYIDQYSVTEQELERIKLEEKQKELLKTPTPTPTPDKPPE